jgi:RNA polymerase sigma factor (sigma-70 family)
MGGPTQQMDAIAERLAPHRADLLAFARSRAPSRSDAEDAVQETLLRAIDRAGELRDPERLRAWLFRVLRRVLIDRARRATREVTRDDVEPAAPEARTADASGCACAGDIRAGLKPEYADILQHVVVDERALPEVAAELGVTTNNATVRLHRARKALRDRIADLCGVESYAAALECACGTSTCG